MLISRSLRESARTQPADAAPCLPLTQASERGRTRLWRSNPRHQHIFQLDKLLSPVPRALPPEAGLLDAAEGRSFR